MRWLLAITVLALLVGGGALGYWLGKRSKRVALVTIAVCLVAILVRSVFRFSPGLEVSLLPFDVYAVWRPWWALPFSVGLLCAGSPHMSTPFARKGLLVFAAGLLLVSGQRLVITALFDPATVTGVVKGNGVCEQTTDYTCGAAAAATLLHHYGVEATEREMAERCWTNALTGTDELCVARGLRQKLEGSGRRVVIENLDWDELAALTEPTAVTIKFSFMVDHWVTVLKVEPEKGRVLVGDPLAGLQLYPKAQFLEKWRGVCVRLEGGAALGEASPVGSVAATDSR